MTKKTDIHSKIGAFAVIPNSIMAITDISQSSKLCLARLLQYAGENGQAYPSQSRLAKDIGVKVSYINRLLKQLEAKKLIKRVQRKKPLTTSYTILYDTIQKYNTVHKDTIQKDSRCCAKVELDTVHMDTQRDNLRDNPKDKKKNLKKFKFPDWYKIDYQEFIYAIREHLITYKDHEWSGMKRGINLETVQSQDQIRIFHENVWVKEGTENIRNIENFKIYIDWRFTTEKNFNDWKSTTTVTLKHMLTTNIIKTDNFESALDWHETGRNDTDSKPTGDRQMRDQQKIL